MYDEEIKLSKSAFRKLTEDTQDLYKECYELKLQLPEGYVVNKKSDEEFRLTFKTKQDQLVKDLVASRQQSSAPITKTPDQLIAEQVYKDIGGGIIAAHRPPVSDLSAAPESRITNEAQANMLAELMAPGSTLPQQYQKPSFHLL